MIDSPSMTLRSLTILAQHHGSGRAVHGAIGHQVLYHTRIVARIRWLHFGDVQVPCPLGHKAPIILDEDTGITIEDPWISNLWEQEAKESSHIKSLVHMDYSIYIAVTTISEVFWLDCLLLTLYFYFLTHYCICVGCKSFYWKTIPSEVSYISRF